MKRPSREAKPMGGDHSAVVLGVTMNPNSNKKAFELDNGSVVDCYQCKLYSVGVYRVQNLQGKGQRDLKKKH
jgi:hypothetical protein